MTWRTSRSAKNGLVDLLEGWEWSGGLPRGSGLVRRPSRWVESGRQALLVHWEWSGDPPGGMSDREILPEGHEWSVGSPGGLEMVRRPSRRAGGGQEALPVVREALQMGQEALPVVREALQMGQEALSEGREWSAALRVDQE